MCNSAKRDNIPTSNILEIVKEDGEGRGELNDVE